ncbi:MAG TPA: RloB domain-containing protein [Magnetococcales bacterium]|nr:RloB domain-containing protein [Magnetococcales bacterium]
MARKQGTRKRRSRVLISCEGEKTEPLYLKDLINDLRLTTVEICEHQGSAPISVVESGIKAFDADHDFDYVFFVFDRDRHSTYQDALDKIDGFGKKKITKNKTVKAITSIPCFEIWFLLHLSYSAKPYAPAGNKSPCDCLISDLERKQYFKGYEKGKKSYFSLLREKLDTAKTNSKRLLKEGLKSSESRHSANPSTLMYELVDSLERVAKEYNI